MCTGSHHKLKHPTQQHPVHKEDFFMFTGSHRKLEHSTQQDPVNNKRFFMFTGSDHKLKYSTQQDPVNNNHVCSCYQYQITNWNTRPNKILCTKKSSFYVHRLTPQTETLDPTRSCAQKKVFHVHRLTLQTETMDRTRFCKQQKGFFMFTGSHHKLKHWTQQDPGH